MNVLLVSNSDLEGGAARATYRLHQGLQQINIQSQLLVQTKYSSDRTVLGTRSSSGIGKVTSGLRLTLDRLPLKLYRDRHSSDYSLQWLPSRISNQIADIAPDIINLHWANNGYFQIESLSKLKAPIVWTLHDMWAFTGGCHYAQDCSRYTNSCGKCPQLSSHQNQDLSRWIFHRKARAWKNLDLTIVTPSQWLAECARNSFLFKNRRVQCIPNGIDTQVYRPLGRRVAREILKLPQNKFLILAGSLNATADKRKGLHLLQPALQELRKSEWRDRVELVVFGSTQPENSCDKGLPTHYLGTFNDDCSLALIYSAADIFIAPSVQDNLPNTVLEAMACGIPCLAFEIGGMPDLIKHQQTGYLAKAFEIDDLFNGMVWLLENSDRYKKLASQARERAETHFSLEAQASQYFALFTEVQKHH